jgi:hypothetical protein
MKAIARAVLVTFALLGAGFTCEQSAPTVVGNVVVPTIITLPPAWTPTWDGKPSPVPGWGLLQGNAVELWLPSTYAGGDPVTRTQFLTDLIAQVPEYQSVGELLLQNPDMYHLLAIDTASRSMVGVTLEDVPADVAMSDHVERWVAQVLRQNPGSSQVEKGIVQFREQETGRVILELVVQDKSLWQLSYLVRREAQVWTFNFTAVKEDFYQTQPVFEQSIQSMQFLPTEEED